MFSTDTEEEAKKLVVMTCSLAELGVYISNELSHVQSLENLRKFSDKLATANEFLQRRK